MKTTFLAAWIALGVLATPAVFGQDQTPPKKESPTRSGPKSGSEAKSNDDSRMSSDMREAIAFQRAKDAADARQARIEGHHPDVPSNADNASREKSDPGRPVKDPGPGKVKDPGPGKKDK